MGNRRSGTDYRGTITPHSPVVLPAWLEPLAPLIWLPPESIIGIADAGVVTTWPDYSGNGNSPTQATAGKKPTYRATAGPTGGPCVRGDAVDDCLIKSFTWNQPAHVWIVLKFNAVGGGSATALDGLASGAMRWASFDATRCFAAAGATLLATVTPTIWNLIEIQFNGASGKIAANGGSYTTGNVGANNPGGITLFNVGGEGLPGNCDIAEVLGFAGIQSDPNISTIQTKLKAKYNL